MKNNNIVALLGVVGAFGCGYGSQGTYRDTGAAPAMPAAMTAGETSPAITAADLRTRLFAYAADSMMGRQIGTSGNYRATEYLARELERFGVEPAGEDGYFQTLPMFTRSIAASSRLALGDRVFELGTDYLPLPPLQGLPVGETGNLDGVPVIYGGRIGDTDNMITAEQAAGKLVVLAAGIGQDGNPGFGVPFPLLVAWHDAAGIAMANLEYGPGGLVVFLMQPNSFMSEETPVPSTGPMTMFIGQTMAESLFEAPLVDLEPGNPGSSLSGTFSFETTPAEAPARNVIGIVRGSDPVLRNEYVAIGAHSDHVGFNHSPLQHDSLRAYLAVVQPEGAESQQREPTVAEAARIAAIRDSLRSARPDRADSIFNGADDDGSGTVTLLELAEAFAAAPVKPARSILFVFHNGEEAGLLGSAYYTDNPTVPRDSIVADLNMDMIGRGNSYDLPNAGPGYVQLIGSRRLSTELGDLVETVNTDERHGLVFDYQYDADGHPQNYYCRSDHAMYARYGIPVVFLSTGSHRDYHQLTDEAHYIDYDKMARIGRFVMSVATRVANLDHRPLVDGQVMGPDQPCQQ